MPGQPVELELKFRNLPACDAKVYRVDLMKFGLLERNLGGITRINLGGRNQTVTLKWETENGRRYRVDASPDLASWSVLVTNLMAASTNFTFSTNVKGDLEFFRVYRAP